MILRIINRIRKKIKKAKRAPRKALRPVKRYKRVFKLLKPIAKKLVVFPVDTFSGKSFASAQTIAIANLILGAVYAGAWWRDNVSLMQEVTLPLQIGILALGLAIAQFAISYPLDRRDLIRSFLVGTGIRQLSRQSTGLVAGGIASGLALLSVVPSARLFLNGSLTVKYLPEGITAVSLVFVSVFLSTLVISYRLLTGSSEMSVRTDLSIVEVHETPVGQREPDVQSSQQQSHPQGEGGEQKPAQVIIRNDSSERVSLSKAQIEDSLGNEYSLDRQPQLRPGEKVTLELPETFELQETKYRNPAGLSLVYGDISFAKIYTRAGDTFLLGEDS